MIYFIALIILIVAAIVFFNLPIVFFMHKSKGRRSSSDYINDDKYDDMLRDYSHHNSELDHMLHGGMIDEDDYFDDDDY